MPTTETSTSGRVRHIRPLPSDSTTTSVPVSATAKLAPETADLGAQELLAQVQPRGRRELGRARRSGRPGPGARPPPSGAGRSRGSRPGCGGSPAPGCGEGRSSPSCTISSARSVSQAAMPSAASASLSPISWVAIDLTLTTSSTPWSWAISRDDRVGLGGVAGPVHDRAARRRSDASSSTRWRSRSRSASVLDRPRRPARSSSQSVDLGDHAAARLSRIVRGGVGQVVPQLGVGQRRARPPRGTPASRRRCARSCGASRASDGTPRWRRGSRPGASRGRRTAGARACRRCASGTSCRRRPAPRRRSRGRGAPCRRPSRPRCRRSSPRTCRRSRSTPRRRAGRPGVSPRTCSQQPPGPVADAEHPQRVAGRVVGHPVREVRADVGHAEHVDEELAQLVDPRARSRPTAASSAGSPERRATIPCWCRAEPGARAGRRHDRVVPREGVDEGAHHGHRLVEVAGVDHRLRAAGLRRRGSRRRPRAGAAA